MLKKCKIIYDPFLNKPFQIRNVCHKPIPIRYIKAVSQIFLNLKVYCVSVLLLLNSIAIHCTYSIHFVWNISFLWLEHIDTIIDRRKRVVTFIYFQTFPICRRTGKTFLKKGDGRQCNLKFSHRTPLFVIPYLQDLGNSKATVS